jgi:threonyl-tRNA synthetase
VGLRAPGSDKYTGSNENWTKAEAACRSAAATLGVPFSEEQGEAAFYGPKIDFVVRDVIGREWQLGTVQVDFNLPERFELEYIGSDNKPHRPVMIHRAPFGSMERFVGILIEHFAGNFPLWLAPQQVSILPISEKFNGYAKKVLQLLRNSDIRGLVDDRDEKIGKKIRDAEVKKVPYMLIIGEKEEAEGTVSIRQHGKGDQGSMSVKELTDRITGEINDMLNA